MVLNIYFIDIENFSIVIQDKSALIYNCGSSNSSKWVDNDEFYTTYENYLTNIFKEVTNILVVTSQKEDDDTDFHIALKNLFEKNNKNYYFIMYNSENDNEDELEKKLDAHRNFLNPVSKDYPKIVIKAFIPRSHNNENENSIILKLIVNFKNNETYSILFTGDANKYTFHSIIFKYYFKKEYKFVIKDIFSDVICNYSSNIDNSNIWRHYVITQSKYPSINIISSSLSLKDNKFSLNMIEILFKGCNEKPSLKMIENLVNEYNDKPLNENEHYKNCYCTPHYIRCYLNSKISEIIEYPSFNNGYEMPIFMTYDSCSNGYRINCNSNGITLTDDIEIDDCEKTKIPLYEFNLLKVFSDERELYEIYTYYLAFISLIKYECKYESLPDSKCINREDFNFDSFNDIKKYFNDIEWCLRTKEINNKICNETILSIKNLRKNNNIEKFINLTIDLKHSLKNIKTFLYSIFEKDDEMKLKLDKIINNINENDSKVESKKKKRKFNWNNQFFDLK